MEVPIICQTYIRFDLPMPDEAKVEHLRNLLSEFIDTRSNFLLKNNVRTEVELKEGSIIEYITVLGSLYVLISQYPKFREGVLAIHSDIKLLTEAATLEAQYVTQAPTSSIIHSEARMGLIGILKGIIDRLQNIHDSYGLAKISTLTKRLRMCMYDTVRVCEALTETRDIKYIAENIKEIVFDLPPNPPEKKKLKFPEPDAPMLFKESHLEFLAVLDDLKTTDLN